jgi:hypothetical protein
MSVHAHVKDLPRIERLLAYALNFDAPRYDPESGEKQPPSEASRAAAEALRFYAAWLMGGNLGDYEQAGPLQSRPR